MKISLALAVLAGCATDPAALGQFGEEEPLVCVADTRTPVGPDDVVTIGYADQPEDVLVSDVVLLGVGDFTETLVWEAASEETGLTMALANPADTEVVAYVSSSGAPCPTALELTVDATVDTTDGRLAEVFVATASAVRSDVMYLEATVSPPAGTVDPPALSANELPVEPDVIRFGVRLGAGSFSGSVLPLPIGGVDDDAQPLGVWSSDAGDEWD